MQPPRQGAEKCTKTQKTPEFTTLYQNSMKMGGIPGNAATGRIAMKGCLLIVILLQHLEWCDCGDDFNDFLNFHEKTEKSRRIYRHDGFLRNSMKILCFGLGGTPEAPIWTRYSLSKSMPRGQGPEKCETCTKSPKSGEFHGFCPKSMELL